jgi:hypothetical protein
MPSRVFFLALIALFSIVAIALWVGPRRWNATTSEFKARLAAGTVPTPATIHSDEQLHELPAPVVRYLRQVLAVGQPMIRRARIEWRGEFNMGRPGADNWKAIEAVQEYAINPPGYVWDARVAMVPALPVLVRDTFVAGRGSMHGAIAGWVTVVDAAQTPGLATAALQRHLGEAIWFPTALLPSQGVHWEPIDESRARATLSSGGVTATVEFHFGADGLVDTVLVPDRLFDDGRTPPVSRLWRARVLRWQAFEGMKLPSHAVAEWVLDRGVYAYWRGEVVAVTYSFARP